ncbi:MAG: putative DNA-binding domain-containing protein [Pseudomonadales bacterium]|nr:putative DNA-binding domain-containing protein [Pseudomonadales bacterium]
MSYEMRWKNALLHAAAPVPGGLRTTQNSVERGFQIYRNNVFASLIEALSETFDVTRAVVNHSHTTTFTGTRSSPPNLPDPTRTSNHRTRSWVSGDEDCKVFSFAV